MQKIVVIGSSGHAKVVVDALQCEGRYSIVGLIDATQSGAEVLGYTTVGREDDLRRLSKDHGLEGIVVAIGDNVVRARVIERLGAAHPQLGLVTAIHPSAVVANDVVIGDGSVILAGAIVNSGSTLGTGCIINTGASLDHDSRMADYSSLAPGALTGGNCRIGSCSAIGLGAVVKHGISIGDHTVIGAGATVLEDVESLRVAYGTPARVIREREVGEEYL